MSRGLCIITGASRGIGAATAVRAARDGWDIAVNYAGNEAAARAVAAKIEAEGRKAVIIQADTSKEADIMRLFDEAEAALGPVRGLVNNAGITGKISQVREALAVPSSISPLLPPVSARPTNSPITPPPRELWMPSLSALPAR